MTDDLNRGARYLVTVLLASGLWTALCLLVGELIGAYTLLLFILPLLIGGFYDIMFGINPTEPSL